MRIFNLLSLFLVSLICINISYANIYTNADIEESSLYSNSGLSVYEAFHLISNNSTMINIIDIRTKKRYDSGHIQGSKNIDFYDESFNYYLYQLDKDIPYLIYSDDNENSYTAILIMQELEFKFTYFVIGGLREWRKAGLPTFKTNF